jgi:dihydrofolate reductase/thymidylate synthase
MSSIATPAKISKANSQSGSPATISSTAMNARSTAAIVAIASKTRGIGINGALPWKLKGDMKYFKNITSTVDSTFSSNSQNAVVMGRKTWESIPKKFRPLPNRLNVVLSRSADIRTKCSIPEEVLCANSFDAALDQLAPLRASGKVAQVFAIGGASIYDAALKSGFCDTVYITRVETDAECDVFFPELSKDEYNLASTSERKEESGIGYTFEKFSRNANSSSTSSSNSSTSGETKSDTTTTTTTTTTTSTSSTSEPRHEEYQYLDLIRNIIDNGDVRMDRTGTGTRSVFGATMRFSLRDGVMPLLTTKRTFWRGVAEELLWFVSGSTNAKELQDKGIKIWDGNGSREYLDSIGLTDREEMDLGPVYGFQWRHFGAEYGTMHDDYTGKGVDQVAKLIHTIKTNPSDRRMIISAWNPAAFHLMALPPCHMFAQFYVANGELSCQMYQRSADMGLGVPFNIASYSLLTYMIAEVCGLKTGDFVHVIGDAHVYMNHVDPLKEQLKREPREFPKFRFKRKVTDIDDFKYEDFELTGYKPHKRIAMKMSV